MRGLVQGPQRTRLRYVPETDRLIFAGRGQRASIRAAGNRPDVVGMGQEYLETSAALTLPETSGSIVASTDQQATRGMIGNRPDVLAMAGQDGHAGSSGHVPDANRLIRT